MPRLASRWPWIAGMALAGIFCGHLLNEPPARAGGPIGVSGPAAGANAGQPLTWNLAALPGQAVQYTIDSGPLSQTPAGTVVINNTSGVQRVDGMFKNWQNVSTASIAYNKSGTIKAAGAFAGGDVKTVPDFLAVDTDCTAGHQTPIIFDADGRITLQLGGDPGIIGFTSICKVDQAQGHIVSAEVVLNGRFQDGINSPNSGNFELTTNEFNQAFTHEFGHLSGLDHSQINVDVLNGVPLHCSLDEDAGLPLMFPVLFCQDRVTSGLPPLAPDDAAWISRIYPVTNPPPTGKTVTSTAYGTISGKVLFSDGITMAQGVNVIARQVDDPNTAQDESKRNAVSVVSGYLFTGNPGQSVTCTVFDPNDPECNNNGSPFGSRDPALLGTYDMLVPPGTYTIEVESVFFAFAFGSSVGPIDPPIAMPGQPPATLPTVTVQAGQTVTVQDIILQGTPPRFDLFESSSLSFDPPPAWDRKRTPELSKKVA